MFSDDLPVLFQVRAEEFTVVFPDLFFELRKGDLLFIAGANSLYLLVVLSPFGIQICFGFFVPCLQTGILLLFFVVFLLQRGELLFVLGLLFLVQKGLYGDTIEQSFVENRAGFTRKKGYTKLFYPGKIEQSGQAWSIREVAGKGNTLPSLRLAVAKSVKNETIFLQSNAGGLVDHTECRFEGQTFARSHQLTVQSRFLRVYADDKIIQADIFARKQLYGNLFAAIVFPLSVGQHRRDAEQRVIILAGVYEGCQGNILG